MNLGEAIEIWINHFGSLDLDTNEEVIFEFAEKVKSGEKDLEVEYVLPNDR